MPQRPGKSKSKIGKLPAELRELINRKLHNNGETYQQIAEWLFTVTDEKGVAYEFTWINDGDITLPQQVKKERALHACEVALNEWFKSPHYAAWEARFNGQSDVNRVVHNLTTKFKGYSPSEKDDFIQAVVMEGVTKIIAGDADSLDIRRFVSSWSQMRGLKKNDALAAAVETKLKAINAENKTARAAGEAVDLKSVIARIDEHLAGGKPRG